MNERESYSRNRQFGSGQDTSRQANQWQSGSQRQAGSMQDTDRSYDEYTRAGDYRSSDMGNRAEDYSSMYDTDRAGMDERRDYGRERGYGMSGRRSQREYGATHAQHFYDPAYGNDFSSFTSEDYGGRDFYAGRGGITGGMRSSGTYRPSYGTTRWFGDDYYRRDRDRQNDYGDWRAYGEQRGFFERAGDEIASWFGDEDAARRREMDHRGRGPSDYIRSDERIREDVNDRLTDDPRVDASSISVSVSDCEVTLTGTVQDRSAKRRAEDCAESVSGVRHVQNNLRVTDQNRLGASTTSGWSSTTGTTASGTSEKAH
ncbi:MAG TPA: BON domain-containing protein [Novosphingobium sp.]|nr:BON domain-containing protein [Novosphingobium sp.]